MISVNNRTHPEIPEQSRKSTSFKMADENDLERQQINELRQRFFQEHGTNLQEFHEQDVKRVRDDDVWLSRFLKSKRREVNGALLALVPCLQWRKSFGVNDLTERSIDRRLFESGFLFQHSHDKDGNTLVIFTGKLYKRDPQQQQEVKRYLVFLLEKHVRMFPRRKITMIMDMQESGMAQLDMEFVKCVIHCFRDHFPWTLAWLLVVELPWIFFAAWKIVNTWLSPEAVNKIKFLSKAELPELIDEDKLLRRLGGTDNFEYSYPPTKEPLNFGAPLDMSVGQDTCIQTSNGPLNQSLDIDDDSSEEMPDQPESQGCDELEEAPVATSKKAVTFEDATSNGNPSLDSPPTSPMVKQREIFNTATARATQSRISQKSAPPNGFVCTPSLLTIAPSEELLFTGTTSTGEILQSLSLSNNTSSTVAFKVKTTSPESYRVRPSSGIIPAASSSEVSVFLQPGHAASVIRDKFLVMSTELEDAKSPSELAALWKTLPKTNIVEHRLRCRFVASSSQTSGQYFDIADGKPVTLGMAMDNIESLQRQLNDIEKKVKTTSPESYRVRPSSGIIPAASSSEVSVFLQPGHAASVIRDKFLVMSTELEDAKSPSELAALWKTLPKTNIVEHRLRCRFVASSSQTSGQYFDIADGKPVTLGMAMDNIESLQRQLNDIEKKLDVTNKRIIHMEEGLSVFIKVQVGLFSAMIVLFAIVMYFSMHSM